MTTTHSSGKYGDLVRATAPAPPPAQRSTEDELDALLNLMQERRQKGEDGPEPGKSDPLDRLRERTISEFVPEFLELMEKYSKCGVSMQMDASNFLEGGREMRFEFGINDFRAQLQGTVTTEAIAFHETRSAPELLGDLVSGPMLRLRGLTKEVFREFICERLTVLLRASIRRR